MSHMPREHEALARRPRRHQRHGSHQADNNPVASNKREAAERNKAEELSQLFRLGWKKSPNMMRARAICEGRVILDQAHITDSLIFLGNIIIIEALKCEGFMGFSGTLDLWCVLPPFPFLSLILLSHSHCFDLCISMTVCPYV